MNGILFWLNAIFDSPHQLKGISGMNRVVKGRRIDRAGEGVLRADYGNNKRDF